MVDQIKECTCLVARETEEARFGIRYGAHFPRCPLYSPSLDPVDNANAAELRLHKEVGLEPDYYTRHTHDCACENTWMCYGRPYEACPGAQDVETCYLCVELEEVT